MAENNMKSLDDIVFEHKNKDYGAYWIRNTERKYLTRAFIIGTAIFIAFVLLLYFYNRWQANSGEVQKAVNIELTDIQTPEEENEEIFEPKDEPPPPPPVQQDEVAQVKMVIPEPKKVVVKEETVPKVQDTKDKAIGLEDKEGKNTTDAAISHGPKNDVPPAPPPPIPPADPNKVFTQVDQEAEFKGGGLKEVSKFIARYMEYTDRAIDNGTEGKITVRFVVEKDGSVTDVQVAGKKLGDGLDEVAIAAIKKTSKMWTPAKVNNQPVRSYFRVPVAFRLPQ